jgi:hypothetical protein
VGRRESRRADAQPAPRASRVSAGLRCRGFAKHAKEQFIRLQAAYDAGDRKALADVMTPEMIDEILRELDNGTQRRPTEVETLDAEVFEVETQGDRTGRACVSPERCARRRRRPSRSTKCGTSRNPRTDRPAGCSPGSSSSRRSDAAVRPRPDDCTRARQPRARARGWAQASLAAHAGRTFAIASVRRPRGSGSTPRAARRRAARRHAPDLTLDDLSAFRAFVSREPARWDELVVADGDAGLAATLKGLAETLPWFVERAFASALGPIAGQRIADAGRGLLAFPEYAASRFGGSVASYARDEMRVAVTRAEARAFGEEVVAVALRVDAAASRLDALAARLTPAAMG